MVMTSHIKFSKIDPENPVTFSEKFIRQILRGELRYRGLVISDDLDMKALASHYPVEQIPVRAFNAGCDILLYCNVFEHPQIALNALNDALKEKRISAQQIEDSYARVVSLKKDALTQAEPGDFAKVAAVIGNDQHRRLAEAIASGQIPEDLSASV
jgi:beta-N-acetylhexosaminidase